MQLLPMLLTVVSLSQPAPSDWITTQGSGDCSAKDVDVIAARRGIASCAFGLAMVTGNGGLSWSIVPTQLQQSLVYAHAASTSDLYLARLGLYRSTNAGATWSEVGNLSGNQGSVFDVHFDGSRIVALQGGFVRYSTDAGSTWQVGFTATDSVFIEELHFPGGPVGFATGGITSELGSFGSVLRTADGGTTWTQRDFSFGHIVAADFRDASHGVAVTLSSHAYATADGGNQWQLVGALPDSTYITDILQRSALHWIGTALSGCIHETLDGGVTWSTTFCDPSTRALTALSRRSGAIVAVGNNGLALYENRIFHSGFN